MNQKDGSQELSWTMSKRDGTKDVIVGVLPHLPVRYRLMNAWSEALGMKVEGDDIVSVRDVNEDDAVAVCWAFLGTAWGQPDIPGAPSFRDCGRDAVEFGEAFMTAAMEAGYTEADLVENTDIVREAFQASVARIHRFKTEAAADFGDAQEEEGTL